MRNAPKGCPFFARCTYRIPGKCDEEMPPLIPGPESTPTHLKACWVDVRTGEPLLDQKENQNMSSAAPAAKTSTWDRAQQRSAGSGSRPEEIFPDHRRA